MSSETSLGQSTDLALVRYTIEHELNDGLDTFSEMQASFIDACRQFASNPSDETRGEIEQTGFFLEFGVADVIRQIAASQKSPGNKIKMVHGFIDAEDAIRIQELQALAPDAKLVPIIQSPDDYISNADIRDTLRIKTADAVVDLLIAGVIKAFRWDTRLFIQSILPEA